ncbi:MAG: flagellar biosynthesis protein FliQ [Planctomycetales bacterium]
MNTDTAVELVRGAVMISLLIGAPTLAASMVVGLVISMLQAVTQIQEQTISFVPKLVAMLAVLILTLPWILGQLTEYTLQLFENIPAHL